MLNASDTSIANCTGSELIIFSLKSLISLQENKKAGMNESNKLIPNWQQAFREKQVLQMAETLHKTLGTTIVLHSVQQKSNI